MDVDEFLEERRSRVPWALEVALNQHDLGNIKDPTLESIMSNTEGKPGTRLLAVSAWRQAVLSEALSILAIEVERLRELQSCDKD